MKWYQNSLSIVYRTGDVQPLPYCLGKGLRDGGVSRDDIRISHFINIHKDEKLVS